MNTSGLLLVCMLLLSGASFGQADRFSAFPTGQDMHVRASAMTVYTAPSPPWDHVIGFSDGLTVTVGDNRISGREGFIWLNVYGTPSAHYLGHYYRAYVYVGGDVQLEQGARAKATAQRQATVQGADAMAMQFTVTGDVFTVAPQRDEVPFDVLPDDPLYQRGLAALAPLTFGPSIPERAQVPSLERPEVAPPPPPVPPEPARRPVQPPVPDELVEDAVDYPVHVSSVWEPAPTIEVTSLPDEREVIIASGRFYLWQQLAEERMIEFMADEVVLYVASDQFDMAEQGRGRQLGQGRIQAAYLSGDIVFTEADRTVRADELFYDFRRQQALVINASMRMFDPQRGIPIYLRAETLGRVSEHLFEAENVQLTGSEFYLPQMSLNVSRMVLLIDEQAVEQHDRVARDQARMYDATVYGVEARYEDIPFFWWPRMRTDFVRPDTPLSRIRIGNDSEMGTYVETRWQLARLLGLKQPPGMDSRLALDYFSKRGTGLGVESDYETDRSVGSVLGYVMTHRGQDRLGRIDARRRIDPQRDTRGRFTFRHREYLQDGWQVIAETSYLSDRTFQEWMYRDEFYTDKDQETLLYAKRIWDNQAFSILGKIRINDFQRDTDELPTLEYHRIGQSFWDHHLTWYSSTRVSRLRERFDKDGPQGQGGFYSFAYTRNQVDWPLMLGTFKVVPFAAGSYGFEDQDGFRTDLSGRAVDRKDSVFLGETGVRVSTMFWKEDPTVRSQVWDLDGLRHIVMPYLETAVYHPTDSAIDMRDYLHIGTSQRWQTRRGGEHNRQSVDWMRLDVSGTWVSDTADSSIGPAPTFDPATGQFAGDPTYGPARFVNHNPAMPFLPRRTDPYFGIARHTLNADYLWRISDTFTLLSDMNLDMHDAHIQQMNVGVSRYVHPDISYYVGSRYLRPLTVDIPDENIFERGSHSVVGAIAWQLTPRYTATFSQEYNFQFGHNVRTDLAIVRQYHRLFYALTLSVDESLDRSRVMFSIWPQGVDELQTGPLR